MTDTNPQIPETSATSANTGNIVALPAKAGEQRPSDKVIGFVKRHPVLTVAGGIAAGALVTALLPRRMTRGVASKAVGLAEVAGTSTMLFGKRMGNKAHDLGEDMLDSAHSFGDKAEKASDAALSRLQKIGTAALAAVAAAGHTAVRKASHLGDAASDGSHKVADFAAEMKKKVAG